MPLPKIILAIDAINKTVQLVGGAVVRVDNPDRYALGATMDDCDAEFEAYQSGVFIRGQVTIFYELRKGEDHTRLAEKVSEYAANEVSGVINEHARRLGAT